MLDARDGDVIRNTCKNLIKPPINESSIQKSETVNTSANIGIMSSSTSHVPQR